MTDTPNPTPNPTPCTGACCRHPTDAPALVPLAATMPPLGKLYCCRCAKISDYPPARCKAHVLGMGCTPACELTYPEVEEKTHGMEVEDAEAHQLRLMLSKLGRELRPEEVWALGIMHLGRIVDGPNHPTMRRAAQTTIHGLELAIRSVIAAKRSKVGAIEVVEKPKLTIMKKE